MRQQLHYEFINSQTGNTIGYLSVSVFLDRQTQTGKLEEKRAGIATVHKLNINLIYWQDKN
jgi:hypothetical protein